MRIYWYWPHPHRTASPLVIGARRPGDEVTIHALPSLNGETFVGRGEHDEYEVVRTVPDPTALPSAGVAGLVRPVRLAFARSQARKAVLASGFDVAYLSMLFHHSDWAEIGSLRRRMPLVSHVHDVLPHFYRMPELLERMALKKMYRAAGHLVVYHQVMKDELVADFGVEPEHVHIVPHPLNAIDPRSATEEQPERPLLLFFGSIRSNKGIDVLVEAIEKLGPKLAADVVIAGAANAETSARIRDRLGRFDHVQLELSYISAERKHALLSQASWLLLPYTTFHSQSGVLADAYSYRLPLVVSDVGALGPTVRDDGSGIVVPPGNSDELAQALLAATLSKSVEVEARINRVVERYDNVVVGQQLRAIFDVAVSERTNF